MIFGEFRPAPALLCWLALCFAWGHLAVGQPSRPAAPDTALRVLLPGAVLPKGNAGEKAAQLKATDPAFLEPLRQGLIPARLTAEQTDPGACRLECRSIPVLLSDITEAIDFVDLAGAGRLLEQAHRTLACGPHVLSAEEVGRLFFLEAVRRLALGQPPEGWMDAALVPQGSLPNLDTYNEGVKLEAAKAIQRKPTRPQLTIRVARERFEGLSLRVDGRTVTEETLRVSEGAHLLQLVVPGGEAVSAQVVEAKVEGAAWPPSVLEVPSIKVTLSALSREVADGELSVGRIAALRGLLRTQGYRSLTLVGKAAEPETVREVRLELQGPPEYLTSPARGLSAGAGSVREMLAQPSLWTAEQRLGVGLAGGALVFAGVYGGSWIRLKTHTFDDLEAGRPTLITNYVSGGALVLCAGGSIASFLSPHWLSRLKSRSPQDERGAVRLQFVANSSVYHVQLGGSW